MYLKGVVESLDEVSLLFVTFTFKMLLNLIVTLIKTCVHKNTKGYVMMLQCSSITRSYMIRWSE